MNGDLPLVIFCSLVQDRRSTASTDHLYSDSQQNPCHHAPRIQCD